MGSATISTLEDGSANVADPGDVLGNDQSLISTMLENLESSNITQDESVFMVSIHYDNDELVKSDASLSGTLGHALDMTGGGDSGSTAGVNAKDHLWSWHVPSALFGNWSLAGARALMDGESGTDPDASNKYTLSFSKGESDIRTDDSGWTAMGTAVLDSMSDEIEVSLSGNTDVATSSYPFIRVKIARTGDIHASVHVTLKFSMRHAS